jgi:2'-5' RNA ligase
VFRGAVASYATDVKRSILGVTAELVVTEEAAKQMAVGAQRALGADVGISVTGVAGPDEMEGQAVGTVWYGLAILSRAGGGARAHALRATGSPASPSTCQPAADAPAALREQVEPRVLRRSSRWSRRPRRSARWKSRSPVLRRRRGRRRAVEPRSEWHLTLQFLGRVADADALVDGLQRAARDVAPFPVRLGGGGAFPKARSGTVLWVGVTEGADAMIELAGVVVRATGALGFAAEDRPFHPHLTVARAAPPADLRATVTALDAGLDPDDLSPEWTAGELVAFESDTLPDGARHTVVARCAFTPKGAG